MNKWKIAFFITLLFCLGLGVKLIYNEIDSTYTKTYHDEGYKNTESDFIVLKEIVSKKAYNRDTILKIIDQTNAGHTMTLQNDIYLNRVELLFDENGTLVNIKTVW